MDISYLGHSSFKIRTKKATVVTDPYSLEKGGLKFPRIEADIVTISHPRKDQRFLEGIVGQPFIVAQPGEYEVKGISFFAYPSFHRERTEAPKILNTIFLIEADGMTICHLGGLEGTLSTKIMEEIIGADILMVPVGGIDTLGPKEAVEIVNQIEPKIVLPMHFRMAGTNEELAELSEFLAEMGAEQAEKMDKLSISKDKLPGETKVIVLERKD